MIRDVSDVHVCFFSVCLENIGSCDTTENHPKETLFSLFISLCWSSLDNAQTTTECIVIDVEMEMKS